MRSSTNCCEGRHIMGKNPSIALFSVSIYILCQYSTPVYATEEIPQVIAHVDEVSDDYSDDYSSTLNANTNSIKTISNADIQNSKAQTLSQLLQAKAGIQVNDLYNDGTHVNFSIRGFGDNASSNTLVLLDGMPLTNPDIGAINFNVIPVDQIERIEILPSSAGVLYGDQAVGGVINIISKKDSVKNQQATVGYGSYASRNLNANIADKLKNGFGYNVNATHYDSDNYRTHNQEQNNNVNLLLSYHSDRTDTYVRYWKINQHVQYPGALTAEQVYNNRRGTDSNVAFSNQDTNILQLNYNRILTDNYALQVKASTNNMDGIGAINSRNSPITYNEKRYDNVFSPQITGNFNFLKHTFVPILGFEIRQGQYNADYVNYTPSNNSSLQTALFSQVNTFLTPKLSINLGARTAHISYDLDQTSSSNSKPTDNAFATDSEIAYTLNKVLRFFVKRADSYRFPKTDEQCSMCTITGQPLKPQTGTSYEGGVHIQHNRFSSMLELYRLDLKNEIVSIPDANANYGVYNENLDPTTRKGIILDSSFIINRNWQINGGANWVDAKFSSGSYQGNKVPFVANQTYNLASTYAFSEHWKLHIEGIFISNRYPLNDVTNGSTKIGGYTIYNSNINYERKHYTISWRINNITNKQYYNQVVATYSGNSEILSYYPAAGISTMVSLTVKL